MKNLSIETMRSGHIPAIVKIEREVFKTPWTGEMFAQELENNDLSLAYVVLESGSLVGYMISWLFREEIHLINIAVESDNQRRGIARTMLRYLYGLAVQARKKYLTLEVRESNKTAICLYEKFGFEKIGIRPQYYHEDGENAVIMARFVLPDEGDDCDEQF